MVAKLYKLRRWTFGSSGEATYFTCARPGRKLSKVDPVSDDEVRKWTSGIGSLGPSPTIISLLGRKPDGTSEYSFYSFYGGLDLPENHTSKTSFSTWLASVDSRIALVEHPTTDFGLIPARTLRAIEGDLRTLVAALRTVVIIDSGGETRTAQVSKHLGAKEAFPTLR